MGMFVFLENVFNQAELDLSWLLCVCVCVSWLQYGYIIMIEISQAASLLSTFPTAVHMESPRVGRVPEYLT